ncbi:hypothetical protein SAMN05421855_10466 [Ulvibacter litoralis]|uniref:Uncharacterized protein n=1 Tax=Ulvibacter litoralis TaxID=227084 RepID=A0A1G7HFM3_9FLAO|nr:hypothetical protein GCM10008083_22800 [Ulvibacter litoralis]SDE99215.1 hypothetical protein SAMN05421855_10466 [Ulvibacter litoralis]
MFCSDEISNKYTCSLIEVAFDSGITLIEWEELVCGYLFRTLQDPRFIIEQTNKASIFYQETYV